MKIPRNAVNRVVMALMECESLKRAVIYLASDCIVRATRRSPQRGRTEIVLTIGRPNYAERKFIKTCQKAGEPFPVRKMQLKWYPKKRR